LITPQTKAVIPVNLYGNIPEMDEIISIARHHNIIVIEDAAESIGSEYKGCKAGGFGNVGVFSFHGSKTMTTGEGGMLVTNDEIIFQKCLFLRDHGRSSDGKMFWNHSVAFKYKMSSMQAALGLAQLERIEELVEKKRQIFRWYYEMLKDIKTITLNDEAPFIKNTYWMVTAIIDSKLGFTKENVMDYLAKKNIDPRPFFYPLSSLPAYSSTLEAKKAQKRNLISYGISPYGINLPSGLNLTFDNIKYICSTLVEFVEDRR
jgi:perosamine synthetase